MEQQLQFGIIPMAAKPYHKGHHNLIITAATECTSVVVYVSTSDRARPGEVRIHGSDMEALWKDHIRFKLPGNVAIVYDPGSPIRSVWNGLDIMCRLNDIGLVFKIYTGDDPDADTKFNDANFAKYAAKLHERGAVSLRKVPRSETDNISGTQMRKFLWESDETAFKAGLPDLPESSKHAIWCRLHARVINARGLHRR